MNTTTTPAVKKALNIFGKHEVDNYPYGSLRTTIFFWIEFKPKKGFRAVSQTINPKNGKLNAPKAGTYYEFMCHVLNPENNHIEVHGESVNGYEAINKASKYLAANWDDLGLSSDMVKDICKNALDSAKISMAYTRTNDREALKSLMSDTLKSLELGYTTGENIFARVAIPLDKIKELEAAAN